MLCTNCGSKLDLSDERNEDEDSEDNTIIDKPEKFSIIPFKEIECTFSEKDKLGGGKYGVVYKGMLKGIKIALKCVQKPEKILEQYNIDITESSLERAGNVVNIQLEHLSKEQAICRQFYNPHLCLYLGATRSDDDQLILISEMMDTDLNKYIITHEKNIPSLYDRMKMAYHISCGMNWLFNKVKHFDLKPSNILLSGLDDNGDWNNNSVCKIADFGLSIIASETITNRGTPVYSSPEALTNQTTNSKTDVFSFGWILLNLASWEDEKKMFSFLEESFDTPEDSKNFLIQFQSNEKQIAEYVHLKTKQKGISPIITDLIISCLRFDPEERPTFDQIVSIMNNSIFLNAVCPKKDSPAAAFWKQYFMENRILEHQVSLEKFILAINDYSFFSGDSFRVSQREISILECLFQNKMVTLQSFGRTVGFYGPILPFAQFFDNLDSLLKKEWFYGNISQSNTIKALTKQKKGTFLVRLSSRDDDFSYVLAYINSSDTVTQTKILHNPEVNEWTLEQKRDHNSSMISKSSIIDVVHYLSEAKKIKKPLDQPSLRIPYKVEESSKAINNYYSSINLENNYEMYGDSIDLLTLKNTTQDIFDLMDLEQKTLKSFSTKTVHEMSFSEFFDYLLTIPNHVDQNATQSSKDIISQRAKTELKLEVLDISTSKEKRLDKLIKSFCYVFYGSLLTSGVKKNIKQWLQDNRNFLLGDKSIEALTYTYFCSRPFSENYVWFDFCALIALSQVYKINIFILMSSAEKYIYRIPSNNSKRCIVFGLANPSNWISLLPQSIFKIISKKKKN